MWATASCDIQKRAKWKSAEGQSWRANIDLFNARVKKEVAQVGFSRLTGSDSWVLSGIENFKWALRRLEKSQTGGGNRQAIVCFPIHSRFGWRRKQKLLRFLFFFPSLFPKMPISPRSDRLVEQFARSSSQPRCSQCCGKECTGQF